MYTPPRKKQILCLALAISLLVILAGCETTSVQEVEKKDQVYTYYPPAPTPARYQFLTSFSSSEDIEDIKKSNKRGGFAAFITGEEMENDRVDIIKPYGIDLNNNKIYVCDTIAYAIEIFDLEQNTVTLFRPEGDGKLGKPINVTVDDDGTRYVTDTAWGVVLIFNKDGRYLNSIGSRGTNKPSDIVVAENKLFITDLQQQAVLVLDKSTHDELFRIPREGDVPESKLFSPTNLAVGENGNIYVSDTGGFSVKVFSENGEFIKTIGNIGTQVGGMVRPKGIAVDKEGRVYVVDAASQVVQVFNSEGQLLLFFGESIGPDTGLVLPAKVRIDYDHIEQFREYIAPDFTVEYLVFVTSQYGPRKVSVFGYGSKK
jgi:sugar lactone lactonase YvrE